MQKQRDYTINDLVRVAKRENNNKRAYLIVNPCQGKHIPVSPVVAEELFETLGKKVKAAVKDDEKALVIAFAETATAIGAGIVHSMEQEAYYIQTTRENVDGAEYLFFSEAHSHATEQRVVKDGLEKALQEVDTIVFAEDEVTTGNTICNLIRQLERISQGKSFHYMIASILNGMTEEIEQSFYKRQIELIYLIKTKNEEYEEATNIFEYDGLMVREGEEHTLAEIPVIQISNACNPRKLVNGAEYITACDKFAGQAMEQIEVKERSQILVLGTEEFMYPALCVARKIEQKAGRGYVSFHATTRSPILTCNHRGYPLYSRIALKSFYDPKRVNYIYNLRKYDQVIIITDAPLQEAAPLNTMLHALKMVGNTNVMLVEWRN